MALARPKLVLLAWGVLIGLLAFVGRDVQKELGRSSLEIPGTASAEAGAAARAAFGPGDSLVILLRGPASALEQQGPRVARALDGPRSRRVLSPWAPSAGAALRPGPQRALLVVRSDRPFTEVSRDVAPAIRDELEALVRPPLEAHLSGYADIADGIHASSVEGIRHGELIAAPALLVILLLVFRGAIAAALPLLVGVATIASGRGVLHFINSATPLDVVALNLASMMGLALGVDYSLLLVSRFREELAAGSDPAHAAKTALSKAGRTAAFAGLALGAATLATLAVTPGDLLKSASAGILVAVMLSVLSALTALPAALVLLGDRINRLSFARPGAGGRRIGGLALRAASRPGLAAALVAGVVAAMSAPAIALETGPPDPRVLPGDSEKRMDFEAVRRAVDPGWTAPFEITLVTRTGRITEQRRVAAMARWQRRVSTRPDVVTVVGAGALASSLRPVRRVPAALAAARSAIPTALRDSERLGRGLSGAQLGVRELRAGLAAAAGGASRLADGGVHAQRGSVALRRGAWRARTGASRVADGLRIALLGAQRLSAAAGRLRAGANRGHTGSTRARREVELGVPAVAGLQTALTSGADDLGRLREPARTATGAVARARASLDRMLPTSRLDPAYRATYEAVATAQAALTGVHPVAGTHLQPGYDGLDASLAEAARQASVGADGIGRLRSSLVRLQRGLGRLATGLRRLSMGARRLEGGLSDLSPGLRQLKRGSAVLVDGLGGLEHGAGALEAGTGRLAAGTSDLSGGLAQGSGRTGELALGIGLMREGARAARLRAGRLADDFRGSGRLARAAESGYFALAALDSAAPLERQSASLAVNLDRGGTAARLVVIGRGLNIHRADNPLHAALKEEADELARETNGTAYVGGPGPVLAEFGAETKRRFPLVVLTLVLVTYLVLVPVLRSVLLPLIAVALNLMTVGPAFACLVLLFQGGAPLGGPGWLDSIMVGGIFSIVFGLSIDYEVFLLARMREGWLRTRDTDQAVAYGLRHTAGVITGAALIMAGVFAAFALAGLTSMRQLGVGLAVAVLLDATVIRLVLLPAAVRLAGDRVWWVPAWLERLLDWRRPRPAL